MPEPATPAEIQPTRGDDGGGVISKKIGPLPLWGWVVVGAAILGVLILRRRGSSTPAAVGSQAESTGVTSVDPLTGQQLITAFEDLNATLSKQQSASTSVPTSMPPFSIETLPWRFGFSGVTNANYVWRLTPSGAAAWQQHFGAAPNFVLQPSSSPPPNWLPEYSYQIAVLPSGTSYQDILNKIAAAFAGGTGGTAVNSGTQGDGLNLARTTRD